MTTRNRSAVESSSYLSKPSNACPVCYETHLKGVMVPIKVYLDGVFFGYRIQCPLCGKVLNNSLCRPGLSGKIDNFEVDKWKEVRREKLDADALRREFNKSRYVESSSVKNPTIEEELSNGIL